MAKFPKSKETNQILARLPAEDYERLSRHLKHVPLKFKDVLCEANGQIEYACFPRSGVLSAITVMRNGTAIEAANVGNEGVFGWAAVFGAGTSPHKVIAQVAGEGLKIKIAAFQEEAERQGVLYKLLKLYSSAFVTQVSQSAACNGLHSVYQRCCRWVLMSHDRVGADELPLTHEFLAIMLGVRRAGVTEVLQKLKDSGLIESKRGIITILNRKGLENTACECYSTTRDEYDRLLKRFPLKR